MSDNQMIVFKQYGDTVELKSKEESVLLILSGFPIKKKGTQYALSVMNTQTEILKAMHNY
nr:pirin-like C-terminal cupin domain-containing protein [Polaribacter irgensii]